MKTNIVEPNSLVLQEHSQGLGSTFPNKSSMPPWGIFWPQNQGRRYSLVRGSKKEELYIFNIFFC